MRITMPLSVYEINRKHTVNHHYFDQIDSEEKAYWLGFLWADGSISKTATRCSGKNRLTLSQKIKEIKHLKKFADALHSDSSIQIREPMPNQKIAVLHINSRLLCESLENIGYGNKQDRLNIPKMPKKLLRHFIRGYFDGDGCLSIYEQKVKQWTIHRQEWSLTGPQRLIENIRDILNQQTTVSPSVKIKTYARTNKAVSLRYGKKADIDTLYHYLYDDATIYLDNKHQKFVDFYSRQS